MAANALQAALAVTAYMIGLAAVFIGIGLSIQRLFQLRSVNLDRCLSGFWMGFAVTIGVLQIWHLFFAIADYVVLLFGLGGLVGLWSNRKALLEWVSTLKGRSWFLGIVCVLGAALWVANHAAGPPVAHDSAVYHVPVVRWYTAYPAVLGLGNLHDRLAFNPSSLLYAAMLESGPWVGRSSHVANGLLVLVFILQILLSAYRLIRAQHKPVAPYVLDLVLVTPLIAIVISHDVSSLTTDIPPAIVLFVVCSAVYRMLWLKSGEPLETSYRAVTIVTLAVLAVCLKLSYAIICPLLAIIAVGFMMLGTGTPSVVAIKALKWCVVVVLFLMLPWMAHGILLSGYPMYPSTFGGLSVDWKVPTELATASRLWTLTSTRHGVSGGFSWLPAWMETHARWYDFGRLPQMSRGMLGVFLPLMIAIASGFALVVARLSGRMASNVQGRWVALACGLGALLWFSTAPAPRFGFAILWSLAAATVAQWASRYEHSTTRLAVPAVLVLILVPLALPLPRRDFFQTIIARTAVLPGQDHGLYPYPQVRLYRFTTDSGLGLNVPARDDRCFDSPLPCTPHPAANLLLTHARDGRPKFITDGPWQQIHWPTNMTDPLQERFLDHLKKLRAPTE